MHFPLSISIVPTVMQSDDNQPRQDDESSPVEHTNGLYSTYVAMWMLCGMTKHALYIWWLCILPYGRLISRKGEFHGWDSKNFADTF